MDGDEFNHNLDLFRATSRVAEGRGGVLHCGFQAHVLSSNLESIANG